MDVYLENFMTPKSFLQFEIGQKLDISLFEMKKDYNPIGENGSSYYFFNQEIDVEVITKNHLIHSFDILLSNQENQLFLSSYQGNNLNLNVCSFDSLLLYLNQNGLNYDLAPNLSDQVISIIYYTTLKLTFYFEKYSQAKTHLS